MELQIGTLVFAKMKGFPFWPGLISEPPADLKKSASNSKYCIRFFGSNNYSWIEKENIKTYEDNKDLLQTGGKAASFKKARSEMEKYIINDHKFSDTDKVFDNLVLSSVVAEKSPKVSTEKLTKVSTEKLTKVGAEKPLNPPKKKVSQERMSVRKSIRLSICRPMKSQLLLDDFKSPEKEVPKSITEGRRSSLDETKLSLNKTNNSFSLNSHTIRPPRPETPPQAMEIIHDPLVKNIEPTNLNLGFIGLGKMGFGMLKNLLASKHKVTYWNRTIKEECEIEGGSKAATPGDVVYRSDITFCCVSNGDAASEISRAVLQEMSVGKAYVEMSGIDPPSSQAIADAVTAAGGRYLEVRFQGSKREAEAGTLMVLAAGDRSLYDDCHLAFLSFGTQLTFLGEVGKASNLYLVVQSFLAGFLGAMTKVTTMAKDLSMPMDQVLHCFAMWDIMSPDLIEKCRDALKRDLPTEKTIKDFQKDMDLVFEWSDRLDISMSQVSQANEHLKFCKSLGWGEKDYGCMLLAKKI